MRHASLFSGIGGFDLSAEWMGWTNVFQVEIDPFCTKVLEKNFPETKKYGDIKLFDPTPYAGTIDILTASTPCQPFSTAGKRKGTGDDRHLWPEALRVIQSIKPTWCILENVRGLLSIEQGMVFEQVCLDLEANGYEVQTLVIPACRATAPHRRDRIWFIAHSINGRSGGEESGVSRSSDCLQEKHRQKDCSSRELVGTNSDRETLQPTSDPECQRHERKEYQERSNAGYSSWTQWDANWADRATELCKLDDGLPVELGEFKLSKAGHRNNQIKAYGNAIVPAVAYQIFKSL